MTGQAPDIKKAVVDTNIIIYVLQGLEEAVNSMEIFEQNEVELYFSTIVEAELFSFHQLTDEQKIIIRELLNLGELIEVDSAVALQAAGFRALSRKKYSRKMKLPDALVAATAFINSAVLITRNIKDFSHLEKQGLEVWSPFIE